MDIPGYRIIRKVGHGATAYVYVAVQESLDRKVALKILTPALASDPEYSKRFLKEGRIIATLPTHPHLVTIHDVGNHEGQYYMSMEYLAGGTLTDIIKKGLTLKFSLKILEQVATSLAHIHKHHVIHRDIKPGNIMFRDEDTAVLSDFGIAKQTDSTAAEATALGTTIGTPYYMSPEQVEGKRPSEQSDLYSLGIVLFEMLTGQKPYDGENVFAILWKHQQEPVPQLPEKYAQLQPLLERLLAKDPMDRYPSATDLIKTIRNIAAVIDEDTLNISTDDLFKWERPHETVVIKRKVEWSKWAGGILIGGLTSILVYLAIPKSPPLEPPPVDLGVQILAPPKQFNNQLSKAENDKISRLVEAGFAHLELGRLVEPAGSNAYDAFQRILKIDPSNPSAKDGILKIAQIYSKKAKQRLAEGNINSSLSLIETGLQVSPDNDELLTLLEELSSKVPD